jgi:hypothetical protein
MEEFPYYTGPCQVRFFDGQDYLGGIAYQDYIICGCCGGIFQIADLLKVAKDEGVSEDDAIVELEWINIEEEIRGVE